MGAAGDMLMAALLELLPDPDSFVSKLNALAIPEVHFEKEKKKYVATTLEAVKEIEKKYPYWI